MNTLWSYFWPLFGAGLLLGTVGGLVVFRRGTTLWPLLAGAAASLAAAALWQGPLGGGNRLAAEIEGTARTTLEYYEMPQVSARLHRDPLTRRLLLAGPADDFQREELVRILREIPGVNSVSWRRSGGGLPLLAESFVICLIGFLLGALLAYGVGLRRRHNAEWRW